MCKPCLPLYILAFNVLICIPAAAEIQWSKQLCYSRAWQSMSVNSPGNCQIELCCWGRARDTIILTAQFFKVSTNSTAFTVIPMILVFDVWKKSQALKGMGLKYQGKKSAAVYFGSWGYRKPSTSWQFYDVYFYIFTTWRYFFNYEDILWGIKHIISFEKKWGFPLWFPFLVHQYINE